MLKSLATTLRVVAVSVGLALVAAPLMAQDASGPPPGPPPADSGHHMRGPHGPPGAMLLKGITLSSDQQAKVKAIHEKYRASMDSIRQSGNRQGMRQVMESESADIRNVLTADQQKIFDANVSEMKQRMQQMRAQHSQGQTSN